VTGAANIYVQQVEHVVVGDANMYRYSF
jgi:hypothetical protein